MAVTLVIGQNYVFSIFSSFFFNLFRENPWNSVLMLLFLWKSSKVCVTARFPETETSFAVLATHLDHISEEGCSVEEFRCLKRIHIAITGFTGLQLSNKLNLCWHGRMQISQNMDPRVLFWNDCIWSVLQRIACAASRLPCLPFEGRETSASWVHFVSSTKTQQGPSASPCRRPKRSLEKNNKGLKLAIMFGDIYFWL